MADVPHSGQSALARPILAVFVGLLVFSPAVVRSQASAHHPGRWSAGRNWIKTPIHLNLLRGVDSLHSQVLWWQAHRPPHDQNPGFHGGSGAGARRTR